MNSTESQNTHQYKKLIVFLYDGNVQSELNNIFNERLIYKRLL